MPKSAPPPWEQQDGEPAAAYARFLLYRNLGPARTLDEAYRSTLAHPLIPSDTPSRAPGSWRRLSVRWRWGERADAWDVSMLTEVGRGCVVRFIAALDCLSCKVLGSMVCDDLLPNTWKEALDAFSVLGQHVSPDAVRAVTEYGRRLQEGLRLVPGEPETGETA